MQNTEVTLPGYEIDGHEFPASTVRIGKVADRLMSMALDVRDALVPPYNEAHAREMNMSFIESYNALDTWFRDITAKRTTELPSEQSARKVLSDAYNAFNDDHSYGRYVHAFIQHMADELELGNLRAQQTAKSRTGGPARG